MKVLLTIILGIELPLILFQILAIEVQKNPAILSWDTSILLAIHQTAQTQLDLLAPTFGNLPILYLQGHRYDCQFRKISQ